MPLVVEAAFSHAAKPLVHCDRIADFHVLIYLLRGSMEIIEDGVTYELHTGSLFLLKSGVHHWGNKPYEPGTAWYYVHFCCGEPSESMTHLERPVLQASDHAIQPNAYQSFLTVPKHIKFPLGNDIDRVIERLISLFDGKDIVRTNLALWEILLKCTEPLQQKPTHRGSVDKAIAYLEENSHRNFPFDELESETGLSSKYLGTLFKAKTGMTLKQYQLKIRLGRATRLLCETDLTIAQIASETGFCDGFYFSKVFKSAKSVSPQRFRELYIPRI